MAGSADQNIAYEIREISAAEELGQSFLPYSLSVITARALPDVRDGLKPVQRRIIVAMNGLGLRPGTPHRKSARVVGETMGNYHPHGDSAIYEALVRLGQDFSMRVPLVDPHGNFGSLDDPPAASRYTECRLSEPAMDMIAEIDEDTVDFRETYDGEGSEPECLPAKLPNLIVNGSSGIAVGMATNMAPHNLLEVCEALRIVMTKRRPKPTVDDLLEVLPGPDFPTGAIVIDDGGIREAYETGRGTVRMRAKTEITKVTRNRDGILVTELPFTVGPERVIGRVKELVVAGKLNGVQDIRNLSDRKHGLQIEIECKVGVNPLGVLADLYRLTPMEETFGINNVVLVDGKPTTVGIYDLCRLYLEHRLDVVVRRTNYRLEKAKAREHIVDGLVIALDNIDLVVSIIRSSQDVAEARDRLMAELDLSEIQAVHILDMQLRRLTALEKQKLVDELAALRDQIAEYEKILKSDKRQRTIVLDELNEVAQAYGTPRRTEIVAAEEATVFVPAEPAEQLDISDDPCVITFSTSGLVGREPAEATRAGKLGRHDVLVDELLTTTQSRIWAITSQGRALPVGAFEVPEVAGRSRGAATSEMFAVVRGEEVVGLVDPKTDPIVLVTRNGVTKRIAPRDLVDQKGPIGIMKVKDGDELVAAFVCPEESDIVIVASDSQALRTPSSGISVQGRGAGGVAGMKLKSGSAVLAAGAVEEGGLVLTTSDGMGAKLTSVDEIPSKGRGGAGVRVMRFRGFETVLWQAYVGPGEPIVATVAADGSATKADPTPVPLEVEVTRRDGTGTEIDRRVLRAGRARW